ncbi:hypothetical protein C8D87_11350 [Lentzea atacamensis]|uniref:Uncharacterized protein n=2 Tax=Lentzea atacamensis TaxID=531938 RepID=A0ABX9DWF9_9PSEU|nr:hypothetical protein C8D87_11350 [Lentzea atacamensis]
MATFVGPNAVHMWFPSVPCRAAASTAETKTFLVSAREDDDPFYSAYVLVIAMAMWKGEVLGLPTDASDEVEQVLDIGYQLQRVGGRLLHRETKTATSDDVLPIPLEIYTEVSGEETRKALQQLSESLNI